MNPIETVVVVVITEAQQATLADFPGYVVAGVCSGGGLLIEWEEWVYLLDVDGVPVSEMAIPPAPEP